MFARSRHHPGQARQRLAAMTASRLTTGHREERTHTQLNERQPESLFGEQRFVKQLLFDLRCLVFRARYEQLCALGAEQQPASVRPTTGLPSLRRLVRGVMLGGWEPLTKTLAASMTRPETTERRKKLTSLVTRRVNLFSTQSHNDTVKIESF